MAAELVHLDTVGDVATLTLDAPGHRNSLSRQLLEELAAQLQRAVAEPRARVLVLTHTGPVFCAGADLDEQLEPPGAGTSPGVGGLVPVLQALWACPKPTLARVAGPARGGGLGLIGACDLAVAAQTATFAFSEVRLGVAPAVVSVVTLPKLGPAAAAELYLTATPISADRAAALGLITRSVPAADLDRTVREYLDALQAAAPGALAATKQILRTVPTLPVLEALTAMAALSADLFQGAEAREGMAAFRERRPPAWVPPPPLPTTEELPP